MNDFGTDTLKFFNPGGSEAEPAANKHSAIDTVSDFPCETLRQRIEPRFDYPVVFTREAFDLRNTALAKAIMRGPGQAGATMRILAVVDQGVVEAWPDLLHQLLLYIDHYKGMRLVAPATVLPGGERIKNERPLLDQLYRQIDANHLDRQSVILAIGGGALLDMVGYAAATAHRGIRLVRMPSTVLAQDDSGVGVKTAINFNGKKNFLGCFATPWAVVNDFALLSSLSKRDRRAGFAEAVKVGLIRDPGFFEWIEANLPALRSFEDEAVAFLVQGCAELHLAHIASCGDPFELGNARPLDFGHWAAHKLESLSGYRLRHGEAVAIGIAIDCRYAALIGELAPGMAERIVRLLKAMGFDLADPLLDDPQPLLAGLDEFREHLGGELCVSLIRRPGEAFEVNEIDQAMMSAAIQSLRTD